MYSNGKVFVGPQWLQPAQQNHTLTVGEFTYLQCWPANSGFYFRDYYNLQGSTYYRDPIILPQWGNTAWLGNSSAPFWRVYSHQVWASDGIIHLSDKRLKENIKSFTMGLEKLKKINPVSYDLLEDSLLLPKDKQNMKPEQLKKIGFLAQELKEIIPEAVVFDENRKIYGIDYSIVTPVIVQALKEQQIIIESLQTEIQELKKACDNSKLKSGNTTATITEQINSTNVLFQNVPNPFTQSTTIEYSLAEGVQKAMICVYDMNGAQLKCITLDQKGYGNITISGSELKAGMYMYSLLADGQLIDTKKMVLTD